MMYDDILQAVIGMAESAAGVKILVGSMPPDDGIAMTGNGYNQDVYLDIGTDERINVVCNAKSTNQRQVIQWLDAIHSSLTRRKDWPAGDNWQVYDIRTVASPHLIGREDNSQWLYGSSLVVRVNVGGINQ